MYSNVKNKVIETTNDAMVQNTVMPLIRKNEKIIMICLMTIVTMIIMTVLSYIRTAGSLEIILLSAIIYAIYEFMRTYMQKHTDANKDIEPIKDVESDPNDN